jgi:capsular exopolysaccharide synthesis family protein
MAKSGDPAGRLVTMTDPASSSSEAYRTLRANLQFGFVDSPPKVITVTSPYHGEGKTTVCANLGVVLAQADNDVLALDCDLRIPDLHATFGVRNLYGVTDVLRGERDLQQACHEGAPGLKVLAAGPLPLNPTELLSSRRFAEFVGRIRREFDYVLIDVPPVQLVADAAIVAAQSDGVLLVLDARSTSKGSVRRSMRSLEAVGVRVIGTVVNNAKVGKGGDYSGDYGYTYSYTPEN